MGLTLSLSAPADSSTTVGLLRIFIGHPVIKVNPVSLFETTRRAAAKFRQVTNQVIANLGSITSPTPGVGPRWGGGAKIVTLLRMLIAFDLQRMPTRVKFAAADRTNTVRLRSDCRSTAIRQL